MSDQHPSSHAAEEEEEEEEIIVEESGGEVAAPTSIPPLPPAIPAIAEVTLVNCPTCDYRNPVGEKCGNPFDCEIAQCWCHECDGLLAMCDHGPDQRPIKLEYDRKIEAELERDLQNAARQQIAESKEDNAEPMEEESKSDVGASSTSMRIANAATTETPASLAAIRTHLRQLLRPFGPLHFTLTTEPEPSIVLVPSKSLYPEGGGVEKMGRKRAAEGRPEEDAGMSREQFYSAVRDLKALPLVRVGRSGLQYDMHRAASFLSIDTARAESKTDDRLNDAHALGHIVAVDRYLSQCSQPGSPAHRKLWLQHEYFDPYRLFTHPPQPKTAPVAHPGTREIGEARYAAAMHAQAATSTVTLPVSSSLTFLSSHIALQMAELDTLHSLFTTPSQRSREGVAAAAAHPPPPKDMFKTVIDLSGGEGSATEYLLWKRRVVNLRAKVWAYDLNATSAKKNWRERWRNTVAIEQSKNLNVFHPPCDVGSSDWPRVLSQMTGEANIDAFMRAIDQETKGVGVELVIAAGYNPIPKHTAYHATSMSYRLSPETTYPVLLFQVDCALRTLARGGTLLLQLHETHTPFTISLIYLLFQLFDHCLLQQLGGTVGYASGQWSVIVKPQGFLTSAFADD